MEVRKYNVSRETKLCCGLQRLKINVGVLDVKSEYMEEIKYYKIYATVVLPSVYYNISKLYHVWQVGYMSNGAIPLAHSVIVQNVDNTESIDLRYGISQSNGVHQHRHRLRMDSFGRLHERGKEVPKATKPFPNKVTIHMPWVFHLLLAVLEKSLDF